MQNIVILTTPDAEDLVYTLRETADDLGSARLGVLRVAYAVVACAAISMGPASAQPEVIRCLPPEAPMTELPVDVLAEYRTEIASEFETYFSSVTEHIACLDEERARVLDEARAATEAYTRLINTIPVRKDLP